MASYFNVIVLATISLFLCFHRGLCVRFVITPTNGTESLTPNVTLTCQTTLSPSSVISSPKETVLIQITRGDDKQVVLLRGNGDISYGEGITRRVEAVGDVNEGISKGGYLKVTLHFPSHQDTGIYKCHVVCLDGAGVVSYDSQDGYLDIDRSTSTETRVTSLEALIHDLNMRVQQLNATTRMKKDSSEYFSASISRESYLMRDRMTVIFDEVITQEGQGYDGKTGVFTAPADGVYAFFLALAMDGKGMSAGFSLQTNERKELARLYLEGTQLGDQSSVSTVAELKAGDQVKVIVVFLTKIAGSFYHDKYSIFSGFLIKSI